MTLRHLKVFVCVYEEGSITKAAAKLNIAQPAVSQTIKELENYYNVVLFERINQRIKVTSAGNDLYFKAKNVLSSFKDFEEIASSKTVSPELRIGVTLTVANSILIDVMNYIKDNHKTVKAYTYVNNANEIISQINNGLLDFGFIESESNSTTIDAKQLYKEELILVCGKKFNCKQTIEIEDLKTLPLLLREKGSTSRDYMESLCKKEYITMNVVMESVSNNAIINMAMANHGIAILPKALVKTYLQNKTLKEIKIHDLKLSRSTMIIWHKNKKFLNEQKTIFEHCCNIVPTTI